jgi:N-acetylmuramoyl-L-alanine amidase
VRARAPRRGVGRARACVVPVLVLASAAPALAAAAPGYLEFIGATARPGSAEVTIALSKPAPYVVKTLPADATNPYRVYVDFEETKLGPGAFRERPLTSGPVLRIRTGQFTPTQARVVIDLKEQMAHAVTVQHKPFRIVLKIGDNKTSKVRRERRTFAAVPAVPAAPARQSPWPAPPRKNAEPPTPAEPRQPAAAPSESNAGGMAGGHATPGTPRVTDAPGAAGKPDAVIDPPLAKGSRKPGAIAAGPPFPEPLRVVIDPGHGGRDPGAQSVDGAWEKDIVLGLSQFLADRVRSRLGIAVELTRHGDETVPIHLRAAQATGAKLLLSVHANAHPKPWVQGVQTFYMDAGRHGTESRRLAELVHRRVVSAIGLEYGPVGDGGVRERDLGLLRMSTAPSLLLETAYLSNLADRRRLDDPLYRMAVTDGIIDGIADFLSGLPPPRPFIARIRAPGPVLFPLRPDLES